MQQRPAAAILTPAVMVHFYRGVMDLAITWRARIDVTTNWAIVTAGSIASFLLSNPQHPQIIALLGMFLMFAFLWIEARRFRFYDLWSGWLRLMETDYFAPVLRNNAIESTAQWHSMLVCDLQDPHFKISFLESMGRRLRHNYAALFAFMLLVWIDKLLPSSNLVMAQCPSVAACATIGPIPGVLVIGGVTLFYMSLIGIMLFTPKLIGTGTEVIERNVVFRRMVAPNAEAVGFKRHPDVVRPAEPVLTMPEED
jgi:uncharacterized membrane protein